MHQHLPAWNQFKAKYGSNFKESDHPRAADGKFGSGGGSSEGSGSKDAAPQKGGSSKESAYLTALRNERDSTALVLEKRKQRKAKAQSLPPGSSITVHDGPMKGLSGKIIGYDKGNWNAVIQDSTGKQQKIPLTFVEGSKDDDGQVWMDADELKNLRNKRLAAKEDLPKEAGGAAGGNVMYFNGDAGKPTGKKQILHGGTFHEVEMLEGVHKGKTKLVRDPEEVKAEVAAKQQARKTQQEEFARLHNK